MKIEKYKRKSVKQIWKLFCMQCTSSHKNLTNLKSFPRTLGERNLRVENAGWEYHWPTQRAKQRGQTCVDVAERITDDQEVERKPQKMKTEEKYCIRSFFCWNVKTRAPRSNVLFTITLNLLTHVCNRMYSVLILIRCKSNFSTLAENKILSFQGATSKLMVDSIASVTPR